MLATQPHLDQQVRPVQQRHEARFHRHPVRVFDARGQALNLDLVSADVARQVRQVSQRRDDEDFGRLSRYRPETQDPDKQDDPEQMEQSQFHVRFLSSRVSVPATHGRVTL